MEFTNSQQDRFYAHGGSGGLFTGQNGGLGLSFSCSDFATGLC